MIKNSPQDLYFFAVDINDRPHGKPGVTFVLGDVKYSLDHSAFANTVALPIEVGLGLYYLPVAASENNGSTLAIVINHDGIDPVTRIFELDAQNVATIAANAITAAAIATDAITNAKVADGFISAAKLATDTITAAKVAADAIGASELAADAVAKIAAAIVTGGPILNSRIDAAISSRASSADMGTALAGLSAIYTDTEAIVANVATLNDVSSEEVQTAAEAAITASLSTLATAVRDVDLAGAPASSLGGSLRILRGVAGKANVVYDRFTFSGQFATSFRIRVFPDAASADAATLDGEGEGEDFVLNWSGNPLSGVLPSFLKGILT